MGLSRCGGVRALFCREDFSAPAAISKSGLKVRGSGVRA